MREILSDVQICAARGDPDADGVVLRVEYVRPMPGRLHECIMITRDSRPQCHILGRRVETQPRGRETLGQRRLARKLVRKAAMLHQKLRVAAGSLSQCIVPLESSKAGPIALAIHQREKLLFLRRCGKR